VAAGKSTIEPNPSRLTPKRIAAAVALALAAGSGSSWAAGLGRLTVQSALGQPLRAEVEITALSREEASSLSAKLPPPEAFRQAGLEFNPALNALRFAIDRRPDGRAFVRITSTQPINEPFVDLLVEINWAAGRFVREYTFLLDPAELRVASREVVEGGESRQTAVVAPVAAAQPAPAAQPAQPAPAAAARPAAPAAATTPSRPAAAAAVQPASAGGPVEVKSGDTLNAIATRVKPEGVTLDQTLIALYQANPSAFFGGIHQLKAGSSLAVPDRQTIASVDQGFAREQIRVHTRDFNEYRSRLAEGVRSVAAGKAGQTVEGTVTARVEDKGAPSASSDQLKLSKSDAAAAPAGAAAGATGTAASRTGAAAEQGVARDAALREAQSRVSELERNVVDLQRLLELKNRQLADLQKQAEDARSAGKVAAGAIAPAPAASQAPAAAPEAPKAAASVTASPTAEAARPEPAPAAAEAPKAADSAVAAPPKSAEPRPGPSAASMPAPQASFVDDLMSNPLMLPGLGAILALGAGYGWYALRRRRKVEKFEDSLIAADGFATNSLFGSTGGQNVDTSASVFTSSTKDSGVDVHSTEVDPIAEAEVYIAYGREAQAEEILKEALRRQPDRQPIRAKLLEILSGRKDAAGFNTVAAEMHGMTGGQNEEWAKVVTMGLALDPDNPLYTGRAPAPAASVAPAGGGGSDRFDDVAAPAASAPAEDDAARARLAATEAGAPAVDFGVLEATGAKFADTRPLAEDEAARKAAAEDEIPSLDFDLDLDTTIGKAGGMLASAREDVGDDAASELERAVEGRFELPSLDLPAAAPTEPVSRAAARPADDDELNIDLPALEGLSRTAEHRLPAAAPARGDSDLDLSSIGLELETAPAAGPSGVDSIKWQEMATKLDLASAYEEIGDKEGARELLEEVVKGGDGDQQHKARSMLARIG